MDKSATNWRGLGKEEGRGIWIRLLAFTTKQKRGLGRRKTLGAIEAS
jgi:hypothetical protein